MKMKLFFLDFFCRFPIQFYKIISNLLGEAEDKHFFLGCLKVETSRLGTIEKSLSIYYLEHYNNYEGATKLGFENWCRNILLG